MEYQMKGYYTDGAYWGWIPSRTGFGGRYMPFESDAEYAAAYREATAS